jgi:hypothetical protein
MTRPTIPLAIQSHQNMVTIQTTKLIVSKQVGTTDGRTYLDIMMIRRTNMLIS